MFLRSLFRHTIALAALAGTLGPSAAQADSLFSNFPYTSGGGVIVAGSSSRDGYNEIATQFTSSETATLDSIVLPLYHYRGGNDAVMVSLYSDVNNLPGTVLGSATLAADTVTDYPNTAAYTVAFHNAPVLTAGTSYFVDLTTTGTTEDVWVDNNKYQVMPGGFLSNPNGNFSSFNSQAAFQVNGTPLSVPEPAFYQMGALVALGGMSLLCRRSRSAR